MRLVALMGLLEPRRGDVLTRGLVAAVVVGVSLFAGSAARAADAPKAEDCLACHADKELKRGKPVPGRPDSLFVDHGGMKASTHGRLECVACHKGAPAPHEALPRVRCTDCHAKVHLLGFLRSGP